MSKLEAHLKTGLNEANLLNETLEFDRMKFNLIERILGK